MRQRLLQKESFTIQRVPEFGNTDPKMIGLSRRDEKGGIALVGAYSAVVVLSTRMIS